MPRSATIAGRDGPRIPITMTHMKFVTKASAGTLAPDVVQSLCRCPVLVNEPDHRLDHGLCHPVLPDVAADGNPFRSRLERVVHVAEDGLQRVGFFSAEYNDGNGTAFHHLVEAVGIAV